MSEGYEKLSAAVEKDCAESGGHLHPDGCCKCGATCFHRYCDHFKWIIDRAKSYGESLQIDWQKVLDGWEENRGYGYLNYYQDSNQPKIEGEKVKVFDTLEDFWDAVGEFKFRCPSCGEVTTDPYECKACGWKVYGLLRGFKDDVFVYVKDKLKGERIFMPLSWEKQQNS